MTNISDLQDGSKRVEVSGVITETQDKKDVAFKNGGSGSVRHVTLADQTGAAIDLVLWNEDCDTVQKDSIVSIQNGYVSSWNGKLQLNRGKFGKMTVQ